MQHVSYDGNFQLVRKNKAYDSWDICLTEGRMYFGDRDRFTAHLVSIPKEVAERRDKVRRLPCAYSLTLRECL